jgi:hemoglobin
MLDPGNSAHARQSLYKRLGGYDTIAAFVANVMPRLRSDPTLWIYWKGQSFESRRKADQLVVEFICAAFEGPATYTGPDLRTAHDGLGITEAEWAILMSHIAATLDSISVGEPEKSEFLVAADALKWDIVARPPVAPAI